MEMTNAKINLSSIIEKEFKVIGDFVCINLDSKSMKRYQSNIKSLRLMDSGIAFACCLAGRSKVRANGKVYRFDRGTIAFLKRGDNFEPVEYDSEFSFFLFFSRREVKLGNTESLSILIQIKIEIEKNPFFRVSDSVFMSLVILFQRLQECLHREDLVFRYEIAENYLRIIFFTVASEMFSGVARAGIEQSGSIDLNRFISYVSENFIAEREVGFYARKFFLTTKYFNAKILKVSGHTPHWWINAFVLAKSKLMLQDSGLRIQEISDSLNFPTASLFSKFFRKNTGITPSGYRDYLRIHLD